MTEDTSPENLRKFLENDDPALVRMGISLAKGTGVDVTVKNLEHLLWSKEVETIKTGIMLADEAGIGDEAMNMLCETLGDEDLDVRRDAAKVLGEIGDDRAVQPLINVLEDEGYLFAEVTASALGKIGDVRAVKPLIKALGDDNEDAARALENIGEPAVEPLIEALKVYSHYGSFRAAEVLGEIGDTRAVEPLLSFFEISSDIDGYHVATALGKIGDKRAAGPLLGELLHGGEEIDDDPYSQFGHKRGRERHRCEAVPEALAQIGDTQVIKPLVATLDGSGWWLPCLAAQSLAGMGWKPETDEQKADYLVASRDWKGCIQMGKSVVEKAVRYLTRLFYWRDECYYRDIIEWDLQNFGEAAIEPLIEMFESDKTQYREDAMCAVNALGTVLSESEERRAYRTLPGIKADVREAAMARLITALGDDNEDLRESAFSALIKIDKPAVEPLITALRDDNENLRKYASWALKKLGHEVE